MAATSRNSTSSDADDVIPLRRSTIDKVLVGLGAIATVVLLAAGGLLMWGGANFSNDYVYRELSSQNIFFPDREALEAEGRDDLVKYAGQQLTTGSQAEAYATYINGHLKGIAGGKTYSEVQDRAAREAVAQAKTDGASDVEVAELQATADELTAQRDQLFKGETLRGLLLSSYAWSTIGTIANIAAWVVFAGAVLMAILTAAGVVHLRRDPA